MVACGQVEVHVPRQHNSSVINTLVAGRGGSSFSLESLVVWIGHWGSGAGCTDLILSSWSVPHHRGRCPCMPCLAIPLCCCLTGTTVALHDVNCCPCCLGPLDLTPAQREPDAQAGQRVWGEEGGVLSSSAGQQHLSVTGLGVELVGGSLSE